MVMGLVCGLFLIIMTILHYGNLQKDAPPVVGHDVADHHLHDVPWAVYLGTLIARSTFPFIGKGRCEPCSGLFPLLELH